MKKLFLVLLSLFVIMPNVYAVGINDLATFDNEVSLDKRIEGTSFTLGNNVNIKSEINGISFVAGNNVNDSSKSDYSFIAGNYINLNNITTKDLFVAGNSISINSSNIERDVYVAGSSVKISGQIGRNASIAAESVVIEGDVSGNIAIEADEITIKDGVKLGTLKYNDDADIKIKDKSLIGKIKTYKNVDNSDEKENVLTTLYDTFTLYLNILLVGFILLFLFGKFFKNINKEELTVGNVFKKIGIGLLVLICFPIVGIILMISSFGIALSLITTAIYIICIYLSSIFTGYYFSKKILDKKIKNDYLTLAIGLTAIYILRLIPVVNSLVVIFSLLYGMGLSISIITKTIKKNK